MKNITYKQVVWLITYTVLLFAALMNMPSVIAAFNYVLFVVQPLLLGIVLALSVDCLVCAFERKLFTSATPRGARVISVVVSVVLVVLVVVGLLWFSIPDVVKSVLQIIENMPKYIETAVAFIESAIQEIGLKASPVDLLSDWSGLEATVQNSLSAIAGTIYDFSKSIVRLLLGVVFSVYVLLDKKRIKIMLRRSLCAIFKPRVGKKVNYYVELCAMTFKSFIAGQMLAAFILGMLCFIGMVVIGLPYATVISVLIGVTSVIPVLGSYIGGIVSALLLLLENPMQALVFIIFLIALQQFENAVIYPKVIGSTIGIDGLFVFIGVTLGAGFGGVLGLMIGVPLVAVLYVVVGRMIRTKEKNESQKRKKVSRISDTPK